jgi:hypothetical protein
VEPIRLAPPRSSPYPSCCQNHETKRTSMHHTVTPHWRPSGGSFIQAVSDAGSFVEWRMRHEPAHKGWASPPPVCAPGLSTSTVHAAHCCRNRGPLNSPGTACACHHNFDGGGLSSGNCPSLSTELEEDPFSELLRLSPAASLTKLTTTVMSSICSGEPQQQSNTFVTVAAGCAQWVCAHQHCSCTPVQQYRSMSLCSTGHGAYRKLSCTSCPAKCITSVAHALTLPPTNRWPFACAAYANGLMCLPSAAFLNV